MSALHHHRAGKAGKTENQLDTEVDETPIQLNTAPAAIEPATLENNLAPKETTPDRIGQEGNILSIDADDNNVAPHTEEEKEENATLDDNVGDDIGEDEDDEDDFAETLEQLKRLQDEVEDLKKTTGRHSSIALSRDKARYDTERF